jgi:hypothetical protein
MHLDGFFSGITTRPRSYMSITSSNIFATDCGSDFAETSAYPAQPAFVQQSWPCAVVTIGVPGPSSSVSLRSICVPTKRMGVLGPWCRNSGNHFSVMLEKETCCTTEKQSTKTSVSL